MEIRMLGALDIVVDGQTVELRGGKPRTLLAALAVRVGQAVPVDTLVDDLWGGGPPPSAAASLQMHATAVRKVIGRDRVVFENGGYRLDVDPDELDVTRFERLVDAAGAARRSGDACRVERILTDALDLWRGGALVDVRFADFAQPEIRRLEARRLTAIEHLIEAKLEQGRHEEVLDELRGLVVEHPVHEPLARLLILALWRAGHQADALRAYDDARDRLVEELGVDPSPSLQAVHRQMLDHAADLDPPAVAAVGPRTPLPVPATAIIGRDDVVDDICRAATGGSVRLQTITGPGGVGKTRLALACAHAIDSELAGGCVFVDLSGVTHTDTLELIVAEALGADLGESGAFAAATERRTLVVLDNFEQLVAGATSVAAWLADAPQLSVLVTSRERLRVRGEREISLQPLAHERAVELFCERAAEAGCVVSPSAEVERICAQVDNLPLAIELVAPRVRLHSIEELATRLERRLDESDAARDLPARHQSVRATIEWSVDLLSAVEREGFARLSIFRSPFTLADAVAVAAVDEATVASLLDKSLLYRPADGWLDLLLTIQDYGSEVLDQLGLRDPLERRHLDWMDSAIRTAGEAYISGGDEAWLPFFVTRRADVDAALSVAATTDPLQLAMLASTAAFYWSNLGWLRPGLSWLERAVDLLDQVHEAEWARLRSSQGMLAWRLGDLPSAEQSYLDSVSYWEGRPDAAPDLVRAMIGLAQIRLEQHELEVAEALNREAQRLAIDLGDTHHELIATGNLAAIAVERGDVAAAAERFAHVVAVARERDDRSMAAWGLSNLGSCQQTLGDQAAAWMSLLESLALLDQLGWTEGIVYTLSGLAAVATAQGDAGRGQVLLAAADQLADSIDLTWQNSEDALAQATRAAIADATRVSDDGLIQPPSVDASAIVADLVGSRDPLEPPR